MHSILIPTNEWRSERFSALCEALEAEDRTRRLLAFAHLHLWFNRWGEDQALDAGLFWDISERRLGEWSEWDKPLIFGRALVSAGYVRQINEMYPAELLRGRQGYVYPGHLDNAWNVLRRRPSQAPDLVLFLTDPARRAGQAALYRISQPIPKGWLDGVPATATQPLQADSGESPPPDSVHTPDNVRSMFGGTPDMLRGGGTPPRSPHVSGNVNLENQRNVGERTTGNQKTRALYAIVRECKYDNPLKALIAMDGTERARRLWHRGISYVMSDIQTLLAEMTDTEESWTKIANPAALATARIKRALRERAEQDTTRTSTRVDVGGAGGKAESGAAAL